jgi:hypothetical protein
MEEGKSRISLGFSTPRVLLLFVAASFTNYAASEFESIFSDDAIQDGNLVVGNPLWDLR